MTFAFHAICQIKHLSRLVVNHSLVLFNYLAKNIISRIDYGQSAVHFTVSVFRRTHQRMMIVALHIIRH